MKVILSVIAVTICLTLFGVQVACCYEDAPRPDKSTYDAMLRLMVERSESFWRKISASDPPPNTSGRGIMDYALVLGETRRFPERLARLFTLLGQMQDHDRASSNYGNMKWYWRDPGVTDTNSAEFCTQTGLLIWMRHKDWLPEKARDLLPGFLRLSSEGCLRHRVPTSYTNIAIMNAGNLIVSGEELGREEVAAEGRRRLQAIRAWTAAYGTHEFCSPTYYCVDISGLQFIVDNARLRSAKEQALALLELLWTDIAANWFQPARRLAGCHSRSYDYVSGRGSLDRHLRARGWLNPEGQGKVDVGVEPYRDAWQPPPSLRRMADRFPRLVRQSWGKSYAESRTHYLCPDITLFCYGAAYGKDDMPLTVDLPGKRDSARCYFIADGRGDPYGKNKYAGGPAGHRKALHLQPFWAGAQRTTDALGLAIYRDRDLSDPQVTSLQSHFVMRSGPDEVWLDGTSFGRNSRLWEDGLQAPRVHFPDPDENAPRTLTIPTGHALVLRYGTAVIGIRVLRATTCDGQPALAALVDDGNRFGCIRLTVDHKPRGRAPRPASASSRESNRLMDSIRSGVALWVRIGTGLADDAARVAWRSQFEADRAVRLRISPERLQFEVTGTDGPVSIDVAVEAFCPSRTHKSNRTSKRLFAVSCG